MCANSQAAYENYMFSTFAGPAEAPGWFDGAGAAARFNGLTAVASDHHGNLFIADSLNHTIRKVTTGGEVSTLAGLAGNPGSTNGMDSTARFNEASGVAVDPAGNVYVADYGNHIIRKITPAGMVSTLAGTPGKAGALDGTGAAARFQIPEAIAVDSAGNVYVADTGNSIIRKITPPGLVKTLAGTAGQTGTNDASGASARFNKPFGLAIDSAGNVYVADLGNNTIRKITPAGVVTTLAGAAGISGSADGANGVARFHYPQGVAVDPDGTIYVADEGNDLLRKIATDGTVTTLAGKVGGAGSADGPSDSARFKFPLGVAIDNNGSAYVGDFGNHIIRKINGGSVATLAGSAGVTGTNDAAGADARFNGPAGVAADGGGTLYVADFYNNAIRKVSPAGDVSTLAGSLGISGTNDGIGSAASFNEPIGLCLDANMNLYVSDMNNHSVRKVTPDGEVSTLAGVPRTTGTNDGPGQSARFNFPQGVAADAAGNIFVVDAGNNTIRKITPDGLVSTFAGSPGISGTNDGVGNAARFKNPFGLSIDSSGNLYVSDNKNSTLRKITPGGTVTTLAGLPGASGTTDGTGPDVRFNTPEGIALDTAGNIYVADASNHSIRRGYPALPDVPTVDAPFAGPGLTRHLDIANLTTTSWSWSLIRRPANSSAQLSSSTTRNPTFLPDAPGLYIIRLEAVDNSGRAALRTISLYQDTAYRLMVSSTGLGSILPNSTNVALTLGKAYTITAKPAPGYILSNWTTLDGTEFSTASILKFTAQTTNLILQANFVLNPFPAAKGSYAGLFSDANGMAFPSAGCISMMLTPNGSFSGKIQLAGGTYPLAGQLTAGGLFSKVLPRPGLNSLSVQLAVDLTGGNKMTGSVSDGTWTSAIWANRAVFSAANPPPQAGKKYTLVIPGSADATQAPGGFGFGTAAVDQLGNVTFAGTLGDGTKVTQKAFVSQQNQWAFFNPLYSGHGAALGWLNFNNAGANIGGEVNWLKTPGASGQLYPNGFNLTGLPVAGALYTPTNAASVFGGTNLVLTLAGGNLPGTFTNSATVAGANKLTGPNKFTLTLTTPSGLFTGTVTPPGGKALSVNGAVLLDRGAGYGTFLGTNQSGSVSLGQ